MKKEQKKFEHQPVAWPATVTQDFKELYNQCTTNFMLECSSFQTLLFYSSDVRLKIISLLQNITTLIHMASDFHYDTSEVSLDIVKDSIEEDVYTKYEIKISNGSNIFLHKDFEDSLPSITNCQELKFAVIFDPHWKKVFEKTCKELSELI